MNRLAHLDYLRGLAALGIMLFHYVSWSIHEQDAGTILGRIGIYGVAVFYTLSGLTLHHVYHERLGTLREARAFFVRRAFRIFPLLWLSLLGTALAYDDPIDPWRLFLNVTGLFGLIAWDGNITIGAWSIGNELVFYLFMPLLAWLARRSEAALITFSGVVFLIFFWFAFFRLDPHVALDRQWADYVNPLNQGFLFLAGFLLGHYFKNREFPSWAPPLLILCGVLMLLYTTAAGDPIRLITRWQRIDFSIGCVFLTLGAWKMHWQAPRWLHIPLSGLGEASYSVYLLHPLMYQLTTLVYLHLFKYPLSIQFAASVVLSLAGGYLIYHQVERRFIRLGKRLS